MSRRKKRMPEPMTLNIESLSHEGRGVARGEDGRVIFVRNALPGEVVLARIERQRRQIMEANTLEVISASSERVNPPCAHATVCGGCSLQHSSPQSQVEHKQSVLAEQLAHFGGLEPELGFLPPLLGSSLGYRRKARLACKYVIAKERVMVGFREAASHFITNIDTCPVLDTRIGAVLPELSAMMTGLSIRDKIPQIEVAAADEQVALVVRHLEPLVGQDLQAWVQFCQTHGFELYLQPGGLDSVHKVWPETGAERLVSRLNELSLNYHFHPLDFLQVNQSINDQLVPMAVNLLAPEPEERVLDLFCGLGNFTLALAQRSRHVVGVECSAQMVERVLENAAHNGLNHVQAFQADLSIPFAEQDWAGPCDKLLIDPPRSGAAEVVAQIGQLNPSRIVYISCNPATLSRDVKGLSEAGYRLKQVGVIDMFPHTSHVESIAVLEREAK